MKKTSNTRCLVPANCGNGTFVAPGRHGAALVFARRVDHLHCTGNSAPTSSVGRAFCSSHHKHNVASQQGVSEIQESPRREGRRGLLVGRDCFKPIRA